MPKGDVPFTFDTSGFTNAMKEMGRGMASFAKEVKQKASDSAKRFKAFWKKRTNENKKHADATKNVAKGVFSALAKFAIIGTIIVGAFRLAKNAVTQFLPEVTTTFTMVKSIIMKNLLFPLRKALIPSMQKLLDWTRKNRAMFTRFGSVLVNVFKLIKTTFRTVINLIKPFFMNFGKLIREMFGITGSNITDMVNIIIFKLTSLMIALEVLLKPTITKITKLFTKIFKAFSGFIKGFISETDFTSITESLDGLANSFFELGNSIFGSSQKWEDFGKTMSNLNDFILIPLLTTLQTLLGVLEALVTLDLGKLKEALTLGFTKGKAKRKKEAKQFAEETGLPTQFLSAEGKKAFNVDDAIITKDGKIIKTNPQDNIIATKGGIGSNKKVDMNFNNMQIITTEGRAEETGSNFIKGMESQIRNILLDNITVNGEQP